LNQALTAARSKAEFESRDLNEMDLADAVRDGALLRLRPIVMTVATIVVGLLPIMFGGGTGSEVMQRIAAPMVGGMVSATLLTLALIPAVYLLWQRRLLRAST
jgi:Cu(I)/Ag(I) efflux system membrane protein CusA/SilA